MTDDEIILRANLLALTKAYRYACLLDADSDLHNHGVLKSAERALQATENRGYLGCPIYQADPENGCRFCPETSSYPCCSLGKL